MKKLIVFDLKNTLLRENGDWLDGALRTVEYANELGCETLLYSMNEQWTYEMLGKYPKEFCLFTNILLVSIKKESDLEQFQDKYELIVVIGDSFNEELAFASALNYPYLRVAQSISPTDITRLLEKKNE